MDNDGAVIEGGELALFRPIEGTQGKLEYELSAEDVADVVWKAVHGTRMHWFANADMRLAHLLQGIVPERLGRFMMRRIG